MLTIYKTDENGTHEETNPVPGCWISLVEPTVDDRSFLIDELGVVPEFVQAAFDDEERAHADYDDDTRQALIIADCPFVEDAYEAEDASITQYDTHPLSFLFLPEQDMIVTVSLRENPTIERYANGAKFRSVNTNQRTRLLLLMMLNIAHNYISFLSSISRQFNANERLLRESMRNADLIKMLGFEKSLVYFSTSLKSMESMLSRIAGGRVIKLYEEDRDLLDDVFIEIRQAMEMCTIYTGILNSTMETFGSVINNNMNSTIRTLTILTIVLSIPTMVFSFYGMNTDVLPFSTTWLWPLLFSAVGCLVVVLIFVRSRLFK